MFRPGLDQPPGCGEEERDISATPGVPGMLGKTSPRERPERPLVVPSLPRASAMSGRWRLGGCLAAEERRRRWPAAAEKEGWEASVKSGGRQWSDCAECSCAAGGWRGSAHTEVWGRGRYVRGGGLRRVVLRPAGGALQLLPTAERGGCTGAGRERRGQCGATSEAIVGGGRWAVGVDSGQWQPSSLTALYCTLLHFTALKSNSQQHAGDLL